MIFNFTPTLSKKIFDFFDNEPNKAITKNVDKEDKIQLKNMNINFKVQQQPDTIYINESGLYSLLLLSRTKKAIKFVKWIKNDVLPLIRQTQIKFEFINYCFSNN